MLSIIVFFRFERRTRSTAGLFVPLIDSYAEEVCAIDDIKCYHQSEIYKYHAYLCPVEETVCCTQTIYG